MPTVLHQLGIAPPAGVDGRSLLGAAGGGEPTEAFCGTSLGEPEQAAVVTTGWKVIQSQAREPRFEVYELGTDPAERHDVAAAAPLVLGYGRQLLARWEADVPRHRYEPGLVRTEAYMDAPTRRRLEALGYIDRGGRDIP